MTRLLALLIPCAFVLSACPPRPTTLSASLGACGHPYLPLATGNRWVYELRDGASGDLGSVVVEVVSEDAAGGPVTVRSAVVHGDEGEHWQTATYRCAAGAIEHVGGDGVLPIDRLAPAVEITRPGAQWTSDAQAEREAGSHGVLAAHRQTRYVSQPAVSLSTPSGVFHSLPVDAAGETTSGEAGDAAHDDPTGGTASRIWLAENVGIVGVDTDRFTLRLRSVSASRQPIMTDQALRSRKPTSVIAVPQSGGGGGTGPWCDCGCDGEPGCHPCPRGYAACTPTPSPPPQCEQPGTPGVTRRCDGDCGGTGCSKTTHWQLVPGHETTELVGLVSGGGCDPLTRSCADGRCETPHIADGDYCQHHDDRDFVLDIVFPDQSGSGYLAAPNMVGGGEYAGADLALEWEWMYMFPGFRSDTWLARRIAARGRQSLAPRIHDTVSLYGDPRPLELGVPWPGDPIAVHGFLISDCGHPDSKGLARTEIHPPVAIAWIHRNDESAAAGPTFTLWFRGATHPTYPRSGDGESWMHSTLHQTLPLPGGDLAGKSVVLGKLVYDYILTGYDNKNWCTGPGIFGYGDQPYAVLRNNQFSLARLAAINADPSPIPANPYFRIGLAPVNAGVRIDVDVLHDEGGYPPLVGAHVEIALCDRVAACAGKSCTDRVCGGAVACGCGSGQSCRSDGSCCNASCADVPCGQRNACGDVCDDGVCPGDQVCRDGTCAASPSCRPPQVLCNCSDDVDGACMTAAACRALCRGDFCDRHPTKCPDGPPEPRDRRRSRPPR